VSSTRSPGQTFTNFEFSEQFFEMLYLRLWDFMKIHPVRAELFHADRHDVTNLTVAFRNFANAPEEVGT
jgi:hypothetical protein